MQAETTIKMAGARLNPGRQWIGIHNLKFTKEIQPRDGIDRGWTADLSRFRLEGSEFPPIRVFQLDNGDLIPGEGHHRSQAMLDAGEDQILCDVVDGTMEDAIVFAAGSNRSNGVKPMGPKDITKAVEMLLAIDEWWNSPNSKIAAHVGCSFGKVMAIRSRVAARDNKPIPVMYQDCNGHTRHGSLPRKSPDSIGKIGKVIPKKNGEQCSRPYYTARFRGETYRAPSPEELVKKIGDIKRELQPKKTVGAMMTFLERIGFVGTFGKTPLYPGLRSYWKAGMLASACRFESNHDLPLVIGQLIAARRFKGDPTARMVVLCYPEDGPQKVIDLYRAEGFEFLTPEELIESLKES